MKKIFIIDWSLIPVFVLSAYSGIELHVADYEAITRYGIIGQFSMS